MKNETYENEKILAVTEEIKASFNFIALGLRNLNEQNSSISNNHVALQLLASGFERVVKILLILKEKHLTGKYPELQKTKDKFKNYDNGHGIESMLEELIGYAKTTNSAQIIPMLREDLQYIELNRSFREYLRIITEFSIQQRYYYIDTIVSNKPNLNFNPFIRFKIFVNSFNKGIDLNQFSYDQEERYFIRETIVCIEKGVIAISRFFTHYLGDIGKQYYGDFSEFILLNDKNLGSLSYAEKKKLTSDDYNSTSIYSLLFLQIFLSAKSKSLYSDNYTDWPFTINKIKVYSFRGKFYFTKIGKNIFALTTATSTLYKIPTYFACENLKPKACAIYLVEEAKKLK